MRRGATNRAIAAEAIIGVHPNCRNDMRCSRYLILRQNYEAALRRWGKIALSSPELVEAKEKALAERNHARDQLWMHEQICPVCDRQRIPLE
jgi:hypothetical protein